MVKVNEEFKTYKIINILSVILGSLKLFLPFGIINKKLFGRKINYDFS